LREARAKKPGLKGIIITAYPEITTAVEAMKLGALDFLTKPIDLVKLDRLIQESTAGRPKLKPVAEAEVGRFPIAADTRGAEAFFMSQQEARLVEEASRRCYEPFVGECDCWVDSYAAAQDGTTPVIEPVWAPSEDEESCEGLELNLGENRYWRESIPEHRMEAAPGEFEDEESFDGFELNLGESRYWRESAA
jgi:hypothetical protein